MSFQAHFETFFTPKQTKQVILQNFQPLSCFNFIQKIRKM